MGRPFNTQRIMNGTFGKAWMDEHLLSNVKSFEAKLTLNYEDVDVSNTLTKQRKYVGNEISGTAVLHKVDSHVLNRYKEGISTGVLPEINIVAALDDPAAWGAERVQLLDVTFDEVQLMKFENSKLAEESIPFKAGGFALLETVSD